MRRHLPGLLAVILATGCHQQTPTEQAQAEVERLGGSVRRDGSIPGTPVSTVSFLRCRVTDGELQVVKTFPQLRSLDLRQTRITDSGLVHVEQLSKLEQLYLDFTRITDAGLAHLEGLPALRKLSLNNTQVTDLGLGFLARVKALEELQVRQTAVTEQGAQRLRKELPGLHIVR